MKPYAEWDEGVLYCGDCLEILPQLEAGSVDAVVTDPPYGVGLTAKRAKQRGGGVRARPGEYGIEDTPEYVGSVVVQAIKQCNARFKSVAVTPGTRCMWMYPNPDDVGCFFSAAGTGMGVWGFTCSQPILYYGRDPYLSECMGSRPNSCGQTYPNDANEIDHPCAKPIAMWQWLVTRASLIDMKVLDPFLGSGTTAVACIRTGRRFIGIELEEKYCAIAKARIDRELAQPRLPFIEPMKETQAEMFAELETSK